MTVQVNLWQWPLDDPDPHSLSSDEVARAARFVFDRDRNRYIAARAGLRRILGDCLGLRPAKVCFDYGPHGKPSVAGASFNLSHSGDLAVLAVSAGVVLGIDIESVRPIEMAVAARHFAPQEVVALMALPQRDRVAAFYRCWTRKEAWLKARGTGLSTDLASFAVTLDLSDARLTFCADDDPDAWSMHDLKVAPDVAGALAVRSEGQPVTLLWRS